MTAVEQMRKILDSLMGTCRNGENSIPDNLHFSSNRVCKSFLLGCCPHEIFAQTKCNLGECLKVHDVALKADFEKSREYEYKFQVETFEELKEFIAERDRHIKVTKVKLALAQDALNLEKARQVDCLRELDEKINASLKKAENSGTIGDVEKAIRLIEESEALTKLKSKVAVFFRNTTLSSSSQQKNLRVCDICSSYLALNDKSVAEHFNGKVHQGFIYIREKLKELESAIQDKYIKEALESVFKSSESYKRRCNPTFCSFAADTSDCDNSSNILGPSAKRICGESSDGDK